MARWSEVGSSVMDGSGLAATISTTGMLSWFGGVDLADWLLERELGAAAEIDAVERWIGHDRQGTVWRRS